MELLLHEGANDRLNKWGGYAKTIGLTHVRDEYGHMCITKSWCL